MDARKSFDNFQLLNFVPRYLSLKIKPLNCKACRIIHRFLGRSISLFPLGLYCTSCFVIHSILLFYHQYTDRVIVPVKFVHVLSSADVTRRLMLIAKRDKWQSVVQTWRYVRSVVAVRCLCWLASYLKSSVSFWTRLVIYNNRNSWQGKKVPVDSVSKSRVSQSKTFFVTCGAAVFLWSSLLYGVFHIINAFFIGASSIWIPRQLLYNCTLRDSSDTPKLEDTTNPTTHGDWRLYVQN
jgi:hypothetical protein